MDRPAVLFPIPTYVSDESSETDLVDVPDRTSASHEQFLKSATP